jgi:hypothetical protein
MYYSYMSNEKRREYVYAEVFSWKQYNRNLHQCKIIVC